MGAVSEMDSPQKPNAEAKELDRRYFCGITDAMLAADRKAMCLSLIHIWMCLATRSVCPRVRRSA